MPQLGWSSASPPPRSVPLPQLAADVADAGEGEAGTPPRLPPPPSRSNLCAGRWPCRPCARIPGACPYNSSPAPRLCSRKRLLTGLASLDGVDLQDTLHQRVLTLQGVPAPPRSPAYGPLCWLAANCRPRVASAGAAGLESFSVWHLVCFSSVRAETRSSHLLSSIAAVDLFARGAWPELLQLASGSAAPRSRTGLPPDDLAARAARATALVHIGELSAAGRALVAEPLAPGTAATLTELRDPSRRPPTPYAPLPQDIATY